MNFLKGPFAVVVTTVVFGLIIFASPLAIDSQSESPKVIRKPDGLLEGSAITRVDPVYPPLAKAAAVSGAVVVEVTVDEKGDVISAQALSGHPLLKDSAFTA